MRPKPAAVRVSRPVVRRPQRPPRQPRNRGVGRAAASLYRTAKRILLRQIDRLANPRVHMGEIQPRRTPIPGVMTSAGKCLYNFTPTTQYHVVVLGNTYSAVGVCTGTSTAATTAFTTANVTENVSFSTTFVDTLNMAAGALTVACGSGVNDATGFVTVGCIPCQFGEASILNLLDPGDLINAPGAETIPMWDFLNNPRTGLYRKLTPQADQFIGAAQPAIGSQAMVPFVLLNIPTATLPSTVFSVSAFKQYDFYPQIIDQVVPGIESAASEAECQAAGYAQQILGNDLSGSYPYQASVVSQGAAAILIYRLQQTAVDGFVGLLANYMRGMVGRAQGDIPTALDLV